MRTATIIRILTLASLLTAVACSHQKNAAPISPAATNDGNRPLSLFLEHFLTDCPFVLATSQAPGQRWKECQDMSCMQDAGKSIDWIVCRQRPNGLLNAQAQGIWWTNAIDALSDESSGAEDMSACLVDYSLGELNAAAGKTKEAEDRFRRAAKNCEADNVRILALTGLGLTLLTQEKPKESLRSLLDAQTATTLSEDVFVTQDKDRLLFSIAQVHLSLGRNERACHILQRLTSGTKALEGIVGIQTWPRLRGTPPLPSISSEAARLAAKTCK